MAFEGINFGLASPTVRLKTPQEVESEALNLQNMRQQTALGGLSLQQQRQAMADAAEFKQLAQQTGGDPNAMYAELLKRGRVEQAQKLQLGMQEQAKAKSLAYQTQQKALLDFNEAQQSVLRKANATNWDAIQAELKANADNFAKSTGIQLNTNQNDHPVAFDEGWVKSKINSLQTAAERQKQEELDLRRQELGNFGGFHAAIGPNGQPGVFQSNKAGEVRQVPGLKPIPAAAITIDNRNKAAIENDITQHPLYAQAKSISDLKQGLPMRQGKQAAELNALIAKIRESEGKPAYDANQWTKVKRSNEYFTGNGAGARILTSNDTLYGHADEVLETLGAAKLDDTRALNTINQFLSRQTGQDAKYKDLKVASKVYAMELAGMLGEKDMHGRQQIMDLFSTVDSPASFRSAVEQAKKMAATRSASLANQYFRETGLDPVEAGIIPDRVARGAVNSVAAKGYEWAKKYRHGGDEGGGGATGYTPKNGWSLKPPGGNPDVKSVGLNKRFPNAVWVKDGPDGPGWYEKHGGQVGRVE